MITPDPSLFGCNSTLLPNFLPRNLDWRPKSFFTLTHPDASAEPCSLTIKRGTILSTACCLCWCQHPTSATQNIPKLRLSTINYAQKIAHFAPLQQITPEYKVYCPNIILTPYRWLLGLVLGDIFSSFWSRGWQYLYGIRG